MATAPTRTRFNLNEIARRDPKARTIYGMAKKLKVTRQTVYRYVDGRGTFDSRVAETVAEFLPDIVDPGMMLVITARERERQAEAREHWTGVLRKLAAAAAAVLVAVQLAQVELAPIGAAVQRVAIAPTMTSEYTLYALLLLTLFLTGRRWQPSRI